MRYLRTNTATRITVGPFLDVTDGVTPEVALTATNEKLTFVVDTAGVPTLVIDANATAAAGNNDFVHITGDDAGFYDLELTAAQTNYVGRAILTITYATDHRVVVHEFEILPAEAYDALVSGTDQLDVTFSSPSRPAAYEHLHRRWRGASGQLVIATTDSGDLTLTTVKSSLYTIYIERIDVTIKTDAAQTITFKDTATSATFVEATESSPGANTKYTWEFPGGKALAAGKNFIATLSGAGLGAHVSWIGHQRKT